MLPSRTWALFALVAALLTGCAAATAGAGSDGASRTGRAAPDFGPHGPGADDRPDPALSGQPVPTVPPGDPDGSVVDEVHDDASHDDGGDDEHASDRPVPAAALLDAETVGALAGGSWATEAADRDPCLTRSLVGVAATRSGALTAADSRVVQVVGRVTDATARAAVDDAADRLVACGFRRAGDPRLGESSVELDRPDDPGVTRAVVVAAEGAVTVVAAGGRAADDLAWAGLADLSVGTLCAAGRHGCH